MSGRKINRYYSDRPPASQLLSFREAMFIERCATSQIITGCSKTPQDAGALARSIISLAVSCSSAIAITGRKRERERVRVYHDRLGDGIESRRVNSTSKARMKFRCLLSNRITAGRLKPVKRHRFLTLSVLLHTAGATNKRAWPCGVIALVSTVAVDRDYARRVDFPRPRLRRSRSIVAPNALSSGGEQRIGEKARKQPFASQKEVDYFAGPLLAAVN